jgi:multidrug efflux pump subunit AcrA (membrane-fusion protein)
LDQKSYFFQKKAIALALLIISQGFSADVSAADQPLVTKDHGDKKSAPFQSIILAQDQKKSEKKEDDLNSPGHSQTQPSGTEEKDSASRAGPQNAVKEVDQKSSQAIGVGAMGYIAPCSGIVHVHPSPSGSFVVKKLYVRIGDVIQKDQILATSDDYSIREVETLEHMLKVKTALFDVKKAENNFVFSKKMKDRREKISSFKGAIAPEAVESVQNNCNEAEINLHKSKIALEIAKNQLQYSQENLRQAQIRAPMDGVVLAVNFREGEKIFESGLLSMADLRAIEVIAEVHENDIFKIFKNQKAQIFLPNQTSPLMAYVTYIGSIVLANSLQDVDPKGSQDLRVVEVRLRLFGDSRNNLDLLKLNMRVDVRFLLEQDGVMPIVNEPSIISRAL